MQNRLIASASLLAGVILVLASCVAFLMQALAFINPVGAQASNDNDPFGTPPSRPRVALGMVISVALCGAGAWLAYRGWKRLSLRNQETALADLSVHDDNEAHMQSFEERLKSFLASDTEFSGYIFMSVWNDLLPEVEEAARKHMLMLTFLGTHAAIQTVCEKVFGLEGDDATKFYLEHFVDGPAPDRKYSAIASHIHNIRNVMAHRGFSKSQHFTAYDWGLSGGFAWNGNTLLINPDIYIADFMAGKGNYSKVRRKLVDPDPVTLVKRKYEFIRSWLELPKGDALHQDFKKIQQCADEPSVRAEEAVLKRKLAAKYSL